VIELFHARVAVKVAKTDVGYPHWPAIIRPMPYGQRTQAKVAWVDSTNTPPAAAGKS
jgi:hypothetical protein